MNRQDFRLFHRLRVRWAEVDMQKIVFNAHYLMYFDTAITDYWRALGLPFEEAMHQLGGDLYVKKASIEYHASAHFDDQLDVALKCSRIGNSSMVFSGSIFRGDELLITSELVYVFADPASQTSRPVPLQLRQLVERFEAGDLVLELKIGDWPRLKQACVQLRTSVFIEELGMAPGSECDEADHLALHAVACNALGQVVATGQLDGFDGATVKIGRMAVHRALRGSGVGAMLLQTLLELARQRGHTKVSLQVPQRTEGFYRRRGFLARKAMYGASGNSLIDMDRAL